MKSKMQIIGTIVVVLAVALGAWSVAFAESKPGSNLISRLFRADSPEVQVERQAPQAAGTPQAVDDNPHPEDLTPEAEHGPEMTGTAEPGDDNGGHGEVETHAEVTGTVSAIDETSVTINGQVFTLAPNAEGASSVKVGDAVKLEFFTNPDGSIVVREVKLADASASSDDQSQSTDDSSATHESGDDSGGHGGSGGGSGNGGGSDDGSGG